MEDRGQTPQEDSCNSRDVAHPSLPGSALLEGRRTLTNATEVCPRAKLIYLLWRLGQYRSISELAGVLEVDPSYIKAIVGIGVGGKDIRYQKMREEVAKLEMGGVSVREQARHYLETIDEQRKQTTLGD